MSVDGKLLSASRDDQRTDFIPMLQAGDIFDLADAIYPPQVERHHYNVSQLGNNSSYASSIYAPQVEGHHFNVSQLGTTPAYASGTYPPQYEGHHPNVSHLGTTSTYGSGIYPPQVEGHYSNVSQLGTIPAYGSGIYPTQVAGHHSNVSPLGNISTYGSGIYPPQVAGHHSNVSQLGSTSTYASGTELWDEGSNAHIDSTLFSTQDSIDNSSRLNTLGNHYVGGPDQHSMHTHNDECRESRAIVGSVGSNRRGKVVDPKEALVAERLWNFEASHESSFNEAAAAELLLADDIFATAVQLPYDPLWIENLMLDRSSFKIPRSNLKFEKLFLDKIIVQGDILVLGDADEGINKNLRNTALVTSVSKASNWWPDLQIRSKKEPSGYRVLTRCKGTQELMKALLEEDGRLHSGKNGAWKLVSLFRMGTNLGTLAEIRDEFSFWVDQVDKWAAKNGQRRRARRDVRGSNLIWRDPKFQQVLPDGSTRPADHLQLDPISQHHTSG